MQTNIGKDVTKTLEELETRLFLGAVIDTKHLNNQMSGYVYLQIKNITNNNIETNEQSYNFLSDKNVRKYYENITKYILEYGDYLLYQKNNYFFIFRYEDNVKYKVIPDENFIIIRTESSYLINYLKTPQGKKYFEEQINLLYQQGGDTIDGTFIEGLKNIKITNILENKKNRENNEIEEQDKNTLESESIKKIPLEKGDITSNNIITERFPLLTIYRMVEQEKIDLFTEYQRKGNIWESEMQSRLIESILMDFPIPTFYFETTNANKWLVIDGLQRLYSIKNFMSNDLVLTKLEFLTDLEGKKYEQLDSIYQDTLELYNITGVKLNNLPKRAQYVLFERLNTGGAPLSSQEIRHALNPGKPAKWLKELSEIPEFKELVKVENKRMQDTEIILRFVAFQHTHYKSYTAPMKDFLDEAMSKIYDISVHLKNDIELKFKQSLKLCKDIFGEKAFIRTTDDRREKFSSALFETFTYVFSRLNVDDRKKVIDRANFLILAFQILFNNKSLNEAMQIDETEEADGELMMTIKENLGIKDDDIKESVKNTDRKSVKLRFEYVKEVVQQIIDNH